MLDRLTQRLELIVAPRRLSLVRRCAWGRSRTRLLAQQALPEGAGAADVSAALQALLARVALAPRPLRVVVADDWVLAAPLQPPLNAARLQDLQAFASLRMQEIFEHGAHERCVASMPSAQSPFLAFSLGQALLDCLTQAARAHRLPLYSVVPESVLLWNHWRHRMRAGDWLGLCTPQRLTLGAVSRGQLLSVRRWRLDEAAASGRWLADTVQREAQRLGLPEPAGLSLCGTVPQEWLGQVAPELCTQRLGDAGDALGWLQVEA